MPVSVICTVVQMRSLSKAASASMAMTAEGRTCRTSPRHSSAVSMPVSPSTPGAMALTPRSLPRSSRAMAWRRWRVTSMRSTTRVPSASAVTLRLPRPTTSTSPSRGSRLLTPCATSAASSFWVCASQRGRSRYSRVMYSPVCRPSSSAARSFSIRMRVCVMPPM